MLFGVAGGLCGFTEDFQQLLVLRLLQGIGAASPGVLNVTLIGDLYTGRDRTAAMGYNTCALSVATASYPAIGGALALVGWNVPFYLAFAGVPVGLLVLFGLHNPEPRMKQGFSEYLSGVWGALRSGYVAGLFLAGVGTFIVLYGAFLTFFPLLLGAEFRASPAAIGALMSSMSLATAMASTQIGRLSAVASTETLLKVALLVYGAALATVPFVTSLWMFLIPAALFGIGHGLNLPSAMALLASRAPVDHRAAFMSVNGIVIRLGQTLGPLLMSGAFAMAGFDGVFYFGAGLAVAAAALTAALVR